MLLSGVPKVSHSSVDRYHHRVPDGTICDDHNEHGATLLVAVEYDTKPAILSEH